VTIIHRYSTNPAAISEDAWEHAPFHYLRVQQGERGACSVGQVRS
jgi:hypothetical protein